MSAPIRLKCDPEIFVKRGFEHVIIGTSGNMDDQIIIYNDEIDELCEVLKKLKDEKR